METDEEVALSPRTKGLPSNAGFLRGELSHRAERYARAYGLPHCLSYGQRPDGPHRKNFMDRRSAAQVERLRLFDSRRYR